MDKMWLSSMMFGLGIDRLRPCFGTCLKFANNKIVQLHMFGRCVNESTMNRWLHLIDFVKKFVPSAGSDHHVWMLEPSGKFTVKSFFIK